MDKDFVIQQEINIKNPETQPQKDKDVLSSEQFEKLSKLFSALIQVLTVFIAASTFVIALVSFFSINTYLSRYGIPSTLVFSSFSFLSKTCLLVMWWFFLCMLFFFAPGLIVTDPLKIGYASVIKNERDSNFFWRNFGNPFLKYLWFQGISLLLLWYSYFHVCTFFIINFILLISALLSFSFCYFCVDRALNSKRFWRAFFSFLILNITTLLLSNWVFLQIVVTFDVFSKNLTIHSAALILILINFFIVLPPSHIMDDKRKLSRKPVNIILVAWIVFVIIICYTDFFFLVGKEALRSMGVCGESKTYYLQNENVLKIPGKIISSKNQTSNLLYTKPLNIYYEDEKFVYASVAQGTGNNEIFELPGEVLFLKTEKREPKKNLFPFKK